MALANDGSLPLVLFLYEGGDDDDRFCESLMRALADGSRPPSQIAAELDAWVVRQSSHRFRELVARPELLERDETGWVTPRSTPNASGYVGTFFQSFPNLCSVFPLYHPGQTRIIQFLEALMAVPEHQAPDYIPDGGDVNDVQMMALWPSNHYATEAFRIGADAIRYYGSGIEIPGSEPETRWRNYQSCMAHIVMTGFSACEFTSALRDIMPCGKECPPSFDVGICNDPQEIGGHIQAAVQWLIHPDEVRYVYRQCQKQDRTDEKNPRDTWSMENWRVWKEQLRFFAGDERVDSPARELARVAVDQMEKVEA
ncbi:hypothetical protein GGS23DRAFT_618414 [Durotheca rogersii]|uniref:uncharacterized protein n=1 Tax=Durotheca rogersii TaxID=419775 RepID=UPI0022208417|nr:uncharacterized protein GGS23DRAFT_618414 [Durotheca rogersii]KAI5865365.1 hypothetical protein GGS23DRAFT_618414 [Durotheca rogersii]